jgi:hypothetical protein
MQSADTSPRIDTGARVARAKRAFRVIEFGDSKEAMAPFASTC